MTTRRMALLLLTAGLAGVAYPAAAIEPEAAVTLDAAYLQRIEPTYLATAGSADNLANLSHGLRTRTPVTLVESNSDGTSSTLTFTPPTRPMGYGNITHTLDYATRDLTAAGIDSPTMEQLHAALMGGSVTNAAGETTQLQGVLQLRSQGMGWGNIAHTLGISPSPHGKATPTTALSPSSTTKASGITTAAGTRANSSATAAKGGRSGVVTAGGNAAVARSGHAYGHARSGIVTAAGGSNAAYSGITNGHGGSASATGVAAGRVSTAGGSGNGNAFGKLKH
jgi:hypothetical protein